MTDSSVWRRRIESGAEKLFRLDSVTAAHWMRRHLWCDLEELPTSQREQWAKELKAREWSNVDVELNSGGGVLLGASGSWLLRFLERCSHFGCPAETEEKSPCKGEI